MTSQPIPRYHVISTPLHVRAEFRDGYWKLALIWSISLALSTPWAVYHTVQPVFTCRTLHRCQVGPCPEDESIITFLLAYFSHG